MTLSSTPCDAPLGCGTGASCIRDGGDGGGGWGKDGGGGGGGAGVEGLVLDRAVVMVAKTTEKSTPERVEIRRSRGRRWGANWSSAVGGDPTGRTYEAPEQGGRWWLLRS